MWPQISVVLTTLSITSSIADYAPVPDDVNTCRYKEGAFTCLCNRDEKVTLAYSRWDENVEKRIFSQSCVKPKTLSVKSKECDVLLGNINGESEWEFHCPNNTFFSTWGAFRPKAGDHQIRLWYQCCASDCPRMICQWSPWTGLRQDFAMDLAQGGAELFPIDVRGKHHEDKKDTSWSLKICFCDRSKEEL